ncbi:MAG: hypothetical protein J6T10_19535 [Methanobrevibacter sp.]|nr:hypothetical protein [Methanobrevibacter sp.]
MKIELNMTTAFTLRKRIKDLAAKYDRVLVISRYIVEPEQVDEELEKFENKNVYDTYKLWTKCLDVSNELSDIIDKNNAKGKVLMNKLNSINLKINVANRALNSLKLNRTQKSRNPVTGNWEVTKLEKITDVDFNEIIETLTKEKIRIEDELAKVNSSVKFDFEMDDEIYNKIYG